MDFCVFKAEMSKWNKQLELEAYNDLVEEDVDYEDQE